jgi:hypothetical protein
VESGGKHRTLINAESLGGVPGVPYPLQHHGPGGLDRPFPRPHGPDKFPPSCSQTRPAGPV